MLYHDYWYGLKEPTIFPSLSKDRYRERVTKRFGEIYLGKKIATDVFFIMKNMIDCQINADKFEGLLYTILS